MFAKYSKMLCALICVAIILLPLSGGVYRQAFLSTGETESPRQPQSADEASESGSETGQLHETVESGESKAPTPAEQAQESPATPGELPLESTAQTSDEENTIRFEIPATTYSLSPNERIVRSFAELRDALSSNNGITAIHLGNDVTMQGGVSINSNKTHIMVDGIDPTNPDQTEPYTLTDMNSATFTDTIYASSSGIKEIIVRDLKIVGKNYYGPFSVLDAADMAGLKLVFERVEYNGPQLGYHRRGKIYVIDCAVRLHSGNGICSNQEFSEAKELVFEGVNSIETAATATSVFWHPLGGAFTIADDSSLTLTSPNTSDIFGLFYADGSANDVDISVGRRSALDFSILNSVAPIANVTISSLTVREGGSFNLMTKAAANRAVLSIGGDITLESGASFKITSFGGNYPALELRTGDIKIGEDAVFHITSPKAHSSLLSMYGRSFACDDPASVLFYNPGNRDILTSGSPGKVHINSGQVNYWNTPSSDGFDDPPLYRWEKSDGTNIVIDGTLETGTSGNFSVVSSNYTAGDFPGTPPVPDSFNMAAARVLSFGRLELTVNKPVAASAEITGITAPGAVVRASFDNADSSYIAPDVTAGEDGYFAIPVDASARPLSNITVKSSHLYLSAERTVSADDIGSLTFTVPGELHFYTAALSAKTQIVKRLHTDWSIGVSDTRDIYKTWSVYVREVQPLTPTDPSKPILENAVVYVNEAGNAMPLGSAGAIPVYNRDAISGAETVNISWSSERGILVRVPTGAAYANQTYTGIMEWILVDAP